MPTSDQLLADLKLLHPKLIDLSLGRIERLLSKLDNPHHRLPPVVHVAGTNGKGSTSAFLRAMCDAAGLRVHVYTSPHLVRFHERILLAGPAGSAGRPIDEAGLVDVLSRTQAVNDGDDITQFEITTAGAFLAFSESPADVLILEVGLGGRLDATNVVAHPALSVITPVSIDHADKLGDTLAKIAAEKAGILKPGVKAVISQQHEDALQVIAATAERVGAPTAIWGQDFDAYEQRGRLVVQADDELMDLPLPGLVGRHQLINAATAVVAARELRAGNTGFEIPESAVEAGLGAVSWPARMQRLVSGPLPGMMSAGTEIWLDGGHNPSAGRALAQTLADLEERAPKPVHLIVGMLSLKDAEGFLSPFKGLARSIRAVPIQGASEQPHTPDHLVDAAEAVGLPARAAASFESALRDLDQEHPGPKRILICGSLYLAGHVLAKQDGVVPQGN